MLHAACAELSQQGEAVGYVPLDKRAYFIPEVLEGMEQLALVCIDNIECIAGDEQWEMAMFNLYNRIVETGRTRLLITAIARRVNSTLVYRIWPRAWIGGRFINCSRCQMMKNCRLCSYAPNYVVLNCQKMLAAFYSSV